MLGGICFGAVGAIVGGAALGKTTHTGTTNTDTIPTASYVGGIIDINGFRNEVSLLNKTVDQDSKDFTNAIKNAQEIISKLQYLSGVPVPESFLKAEEEESVLAIDQSIIKAKSDFEIAKANLPKYEIPSRYL